MAYAADVLRGFRFSVSIPGLSNKGEENTDMGFMRISGLQLDVGVYEWQEVSDPLTRHKIPDRITFADLTLERGATTNRNALWGWFEEVTNALYSGVPSDFRRTVTITAFGKGIRSSMETVRVWELYKAFPKVLKFNDFNATESNALIETLTLANEGYKTYTKSPPQGDLPREGLGAGSLTAGTLA